MKSILYVEDEYIYCILIEKIMKSLNRKEKLFIAHNYNEAMNIIKENNIDLMITDISLPDKNGSILIKDANKIKPEMSIVVLSNYSSLSVNVSDNVKDFYVKPFYEKNIKEILKKYID